MADTPGKEAGATPDCSSSTERFAGAREEAFSERNRSSSRNGNGRVEKRIEATMANAEPASTARSRKSSHILGLFKENTASQEQKRSQEKARPSSGLVKQDDIPETQPEEKEALRFGRRPVLAPSMIGSPPEEVITDSEKSPTKDNERPEQQPLFLENKNKRQSDRGPSKGPASPKPLSDVSNTPQDHEELSTKADVDESESMSHRFDDKSEGGLPLRLLEEIRNYHNLAAPFKEKFRPTSPKSDSGIEDPSLTPKTNEAPLDNLRLTTANVGEEEDESDKEQISSALYYPHQAPSLDGLQDVSIESLDELDDSQQGLESLKSGQESVTTEDDEAPSQDVDIALQSRNESRYLHGDLQKARIPSDDLYAHAIEGGISSTSESEYDSLDESARSTNGEDSSATDDGETTPKATPKARSPFLRSKQQKEYRAPAAPLGAVELKPYNHQVGGHTTVFRFSKRAVCKQLSNRENEFYEVVERRHPELLRFLPRYDTSFLQSSLLRP